MGAGDDAGRVVAVLRIVARAEGAQRPRRVRAGDEGLLRLVALVVGVGRLVVRVLVRMLVLLPLWRVWSLLRCLWHLLRRRRLWLWL